MGWNRYFRRCFWDDERTREIQSYIEIETDENIARGMSPEEARCAAHKKFGNGTYVREEIYRMNTIGFIESLWQDLRYTFRSLCRNPGFAATAIVTLALGIGANTAVFSVVDAIIFRPLPYRYPGQLVSIEWARRSSPDRVFPMPHYVSEEIEDWRAQKQIFAGVEPYSPWHNSNSPYGKVGLFPTVSISTAIPEMLGVRPKIGRGFLPEDGQPSRNQVALISDGYWAREFGSDPAVLGKTVTLDNRIYIVVGVMPRNFEFPPGSRPDAWVPRTKESNGLEFSLLARLRPGLGIDQAQREAVLISDRIHFDQELKAKSLPALSRLDRRLDPKTRTALLAMLGAVGFVFLIACANVANLMLSRGATRQREIAIRAAIGASQGRLLRHFLVESLVLSVAGGVAALLLASWTTHLIFAILPMQLQGLLWVTSLHRMPGYLCSWA
jgi:predicted permease